MESEPALVSHHNNDLEKKEKSLVALSSVLAAVFLTSMKIVVGLLTGSLGILSEAAHSGLDLVAAAVTYFAVRVSGRPADPVHTYGHGKIENLSALFETLLLLATCVWIIYEAIQRLFFKHVEVETSIWAFVVMAISIAIDYTRSGALMKAAKKYESQALEADALHFSTDIWSSSVVIVGLGLVAVAKWLDIPWLVRADAAAAIGVAFIVVYVSVQLGKRTIADLMDATPPGLREKVSEVVRQVPGVLEIQRVRIRRSGPEAFVDLRLGTDQGSALERAQHIASLAEEAVQRVLPGADVVVNVLPVTTDPAGLLAVIHQTAARVNLGVHGIRIYNVMGDLSAEMHVEVNDGLTLEQAHNQVTEFENALHKAALSLSRVITHIEPVGDATAERQAAAVDEEQVRQVLREMSERNELPCDPVEVNILSVSDEIVVSFLCTLNKDIPISDAHALTEQIEQRLRSRLPRLGRVVIHLEPITEHTRREN